MHGNFWSYRGGMNGALPGVDTRDKLGNIRENGRPRKGETVTEWIARIVLRELKNSSPNAWWHKWSFTVTVREGFEGRGSYVVSVVPVDNGEHNV